ncbi:type VII secretion protein EccCa [Tsukamurella sp. 8F]|uniref:type VII secretion protein EccCa n=1 Tax=unclassified Tsukamurella TaxID=2633480 RepID=UPI0023B90097|nr:MULTISPECIES: type VII secretion protein EccCa [unclassified Tsukamurella]MDF0531755.1 type VII secretion protein EccCa [Tsukamurella sp. 8J]MDF0588043.1 type VII secretion protein EccCa [Tsukamurella sp. 8F]
MAETVYEPVTEGFARRPRIAPPRMPGGEVALQAPPEVPRAVPGGLVGKLMPVVMVIAVVGMVALMFTSGATMLTNPFMLMFPLMMIVSMAGMYGGGSRGGAPRAAELDEDRKDYLRYLSQVRDQVERTRDRQREALTWIHPEPGVLTGFAGTRRMWERRPGDPDFLHVRIGVGSQRLATRLMPPETGPVEDLEPVATVALRRFVRGNAAVPGLPVAVALRGFPAVSVTGQHAAVGALMRAMLLSAAALHGPDHLRIVVVTRDAEAPQWSWCKWLPHTGHPARSDALGPVRTVYGGAAAAEADLGEILADRTAFTRSAPAAPARAHYLVVFDADVDPEPEGIFDAAVGVEGVTVIDVAARPGSLAARQGLALVAEQHRVGAVSAAGTEFFARPDAVAVGAAEVTARRLGRYRPATAAQVVAYDADTGPADPGLMALLGIQDAAAITPDDVWRLRIGRERLRVPIGVGPGGEPVELDIKEAAENGMGPHGLCIGATGSGKSEFLRTLVLSLVATHSPEALNLVLVDFKGGATFLGLERLQHVAAVITNLEEELAMVDRMRDALSGEMNRRQEVLRRAGNYANVSDYERARRGGADLEPLPALFVIVDEFSELLSQKPDFAELFVAIGRLGRSLHMHLLLASQRLEEGRLRGLDSHLSYRIGLKTFSANESRAVLGVPDAYHLPSTPGVGYLKCDADEPRRFHASYVSGPYQPPRSMAGVAGRTLTGSAAVREFTVASVATTPAETPDEPAGALAAAQAAGNGAEPAGAGEVSLIDTVVQRLAGHGRPAHTVWLPPLDASPDVATVAEAGVSLSALHVAIGIVDRPYDQRRDPLIVDLSGAQGNAVVVGGPQSGKSTALRTLILSTALTHSPRRAQFYCLDFGGGALAALAGLPHVGSVASRLDSDRVRRTVAEVTAVIRRREAAFREHGIESMVQYREHPVGAADRHGDVFLVVDGWSVIRAEFESLEAGIGAVAAQGLSYGVHLVVAASRWGEIRPAIKDQLGTRLELRLGDPLDSEMGRRVAALVPVGRPGRGLSPEQLHLLVALPRLDGGSSVADLPEAVGAAVARIAAAHADEAPEVRMLPAAVPLVRIPVRRDAAPSDVVIGIGESELAPAVLRFGAQPFFLVFGDAECGKTEVLRTICASLMAGGTPEQTKIVLVDYRRTLLGVVDGDHLGGYATSSQAAAPMLVRLAEILRQRCPGDGVTPQQLRDRSWWSGPDVYLLVDDYDLVAGAGSNPLAPLLDLLPQARDVGLKVVIARRSGGLARGMYEAFLGRVKDLAADGLVMSGSRDEGTVLGAVKMSAMPPGRGTWVSRAQGPELVQVALASRAEDM